MDLALNNLKRLICHKTQTANHYLSYYCAFFYNVYCDACLLPIFQPI